jgi:hypothetical protein
VSEPEHLTPEDHTRLPSKARVRRLLKRATEVLSTSSRKELYVFVSSPAECAAERKLVDRLIDEINKSEQASQNRILFKSLRWENLPPGETQDGDYQGRISRLLRLAGRDRFELYLGFVRSQLGTPTPRYASGTVEEFEVALRERRKRGLPAEVLFYFIGEPKVRSPQVEAFQKELEDRKFLYSLVSDRKQFEARLREHLLHIVETWRGWRNRVKRLFHVFKLFVKLILVVAVVAYMVLEAWTVTAVRADVRSGEYQRAIDLWSTRVRYLPISSAMLQKDIDAALFQISARRLIKALLVQGIDPYTWKQRHLREFEVSALTRYAKQQLTNAHRAGSSADDPELRALIAMADDWVLAARLASDATKPGSRAGTSPIESFIAYAPRASVLAWLEKGIASNMPGSAAEAIVNAAAKRSDAAVTIATLEALRSGRLGKSAPTLPLNFTCAPSEQACASSSAVIERWLSEGADAPPANALGQLASWAQPSRLQASDRAFVDGRIVALMDQKQFDDISPALIGYLARSGSPVARTALSTRLTRHTPGEINFNSAERVALFDALPAIGVAEADRLALQLSQRSYDELSSLKGMKFIPSDAAVQAAYLRWLAGHGLAQWQMHRAWVKQLLDRGLRGDFDGFALQSFNDAFRGVLVQLDEPAFADLYGAVTSPVVDTADHALSGRHAYILRVLSGSGPTSLRGV